MRSVITENQPKDIVTNNIAIKSDIPLSMRSAANENKTPIKDIIRIQRTGLTKRLICILSTASLFVSSNSKILDTTRIDTIIDEFIVVNANKAESSKKLGEQRRFSKVVTRQKYLTFGEFEEI